MNALSTSQQKVGQKLDDIAVILVVDGIYNIMSDMKNNGVNKESLFYKTFISSIGDLSLEETFLIACCTASTTSPVKQFLATL
ncbi:unnamed protein product [Rhizophagus irregularis]|nr:unnamed protein product [Rhizophagus irregularis]